MFFIPPVPILGSIFDLVTLSFIAAILLLSFLSLIFIFHLRLKSRGSHHLQNFNSLWSVRFLLVTFIFLWALNEVLRVPFFRRHYLYPYLPSLTLPQQTNLCKIYVVLSLGFFEPAFLVTLLFLVGVSIKKRNPKDLWAIVFVLSTCLPVLLIQILFMFFAPFGVPLPEFFRRSSFLEKDDFDNEMVLCSYPLFSTIVFGAFGFTYSLWFLLSCWKVVAMVINKALRVRIYVLAYAVLASAMIQIVFLGLSVLWNPDETGYAAVTLVVFLSALSCAAAGEGILVIRPIADALAAGGDSGPWIPSFRQRREDGESSVGDDDDEGV